MRCLVLALAAVATVPIVQPSVAQQPDPRQPDAQDPVEALLARLSLEQKAGQLFMSWSLSRPDGTGEANNHERMRRWVRDAELGGVILSLGTVEDAAALVPQLQQEAKVPLLLAGDFEGGVWFRLDGATPLGNQMLVGATRSERLAEAMGRATALEAKALGFHWVFAPVLDVNSNPQNPIINVRSFGGDPDLVARLGSAFARGVRSEGLIACGKHFPGHGDVDSDSHLRMPTVPGDGERLRRVELYPFGVAARQGLESVMTGHLAVPGLGEAADVPATLSRRILHDVLRDELGFTGLVVTDALEMGGVKDAFPPGEVAVRALLAGADVLLMPPDPLQARAAVVDAVRNGRVPMARLDDAVRRILAMKQRVGLLAGGGQVDPAWRSRMRTPASEAVGDELATQGPVLVLDRGQILPLGEVGAADTVVVQVFDKRDDQAGGQFVDGLRGVVGPLLHTVHGGTQPAGVALVAASLQSAKRIVFALHVKVREYDGSIGLPPVLRPLFDGLRDEQEVVAVSFGSPYLIAQLPKVDTFVAAFVATDKTERCVAAALRGRGWLVGKLPVAIPGVAAAGHGLSLYPSQAFVDERLSAVPVQKDDAAERANAAGAPHGDVPLHTLDADLAPQLTTLLEAAVADGAFPGAVCMVARHGVPLVRVAVGKLDHGAEAAPVSLGTPFDLASLTKVCATTPAVLYLCASGQMSLDDPVAKWVPAFVGTGKARVTIRHLLGHCSGLPAYERYYRSMSGAPAIVAAAAAEGLMTEPGATVTYSDLGFVLLMAAVERCSGQPFAEFVQERVFTPLGMPGAAFAPTSGPARTGAAPTEHDERRGGVVQGYVHDENAFAMGGVSGHAGLFATAHDVLAFGCAMLAGGRGVVPRDLLASATQPVGLVAGDTTRGLGFQLLQSGTWAGSTVSPGAFGHTGFTGTSLVCDPDLDTVTVLLTNRVHPTRVNNKIQAVRRAVHDLVRSSVR